MPNNKVIARVHTKEGMPIKVWVNRKTGVVLPSHWKIQAGYLHGNYLNRKSQRNFEKRAA